MTNETQQQIQIKVSDEKLAGSYATGVSITYTPEEFIMDFVNILPNSPSGQLIDRIIMSPGHMKRFSAILSEVVKKFDNKEPLQSAPANSSSIDQKIGFDLEKK